MRFTTSLIDRLMNVFPPDMSRVVDLDENGGRLPCYSGAQLQAMLDDKSLVAEIQRANDGTPMWSLSVRNFLIGYSLR